MTNTPMKNNESHTTEIRTSTVISRFKKEVFKDEYYVEQTWAQNEHR